MSAIEDLTNLVREGFLETEVTLPVKGKDWKFKLRTLTVLDESKAMRAAGLETVPRTSAEEISYIVCMLPYAIVKLNDEPVTPQSLELPMLMLNGEIIGKLYEEYKKIATRAIQAGDELKNS